MTTHTLQSLLALAQTPEGMQEIRVMVAQASGCRCQYWRYLRQGHDNRMVYVARLNSQEEAKICYDSENWGRKSPPEEYTDLEFVPPFEASLDAMSTALRDKDDAFMRSFELRLYDVYYFSDWKLMEEKPNENFESWWRRLAITQPDAWRWAVAFILVSGEVPEPESDGRKGDFKGKTGDLSNT